MSKSYLVPEFELEVETEVKKSRFIARALAVSTREAAMAAVARVKQQYPDARHHCWAYLIGNPAAASNAAMNDAGEPGGTAGKPILNVIMHKKIGDCMVIVTRYFGGVKLGAGGLTRAYSGATEAVLSQLSLVEKKPLLSLKVLCDFSQEQSLRHWCNQHGAEIVDVRYGQQVELDIQLIEKNLSEFQEYSRSLSIEILTEL